MPEVIYEINAQVWLNEQEWTNPDKPDLADVPQGVLEQWADKGFGALWFMGVWRKGKATRRICLDNPDLRDELRKSLPDMTPADIVGSPFSICDYALNPALGDETTLARLREKLHAAGMKLFLDFVPNHLAVDHPWVSEHPEYFVNGTELELERERHNYFRSPEDPEIIIAHGRDPFFSGWTDTAQINVFSTEAREAMIGLIEHVSDQCDGLRCDMAMLLLNSVFKRTWGDLSLIDYPDSDPPEFWEEAIGRVRRKHPGFTFLAEVYWDLERELQNLGFDLTYDKTVYDCAREGFGAGVRNRVRSMSDAAGKMVHFIENHDEDRAPEAFGDRAQAAAVLVGALPGVTLLHEGMFEGRRVKIPVQLARRPYEEPDEEMRRFYDALLEVLKHPAFQGGDFEMLGVDKAWEGNPTHGAIVCFWRRAGEERRLVAVNLGAHQAQAYTRPPAEGLDAKVIELRDLLSDACYYRSTDELARKGLFLDMSPGLYHVFTVRNVPKEAAEHSDRP